MKLTREQQLPLEALLQRHPAVGLLGPRQVGKTTLARTLNVPRPTVYLDLESPLS